MKIFGSILNKYLKFLFENDSLMVELIAKNGCRSELADAIECHLLGKKNK